MQVNMKVSFTQSFRRQMKKFNYMLSMRSKTYYQGTS